MSSNAQRLAEAVLSRRTELDQTQLEVWQAGGPSNTTLTKVENGELTTLTRTTARKLDAALGWVPGSAKAVFEQGVPPMVASAEDETDGDNVTYVGDFRAWVLTTDELSDHQRRAVLAAMKGERGRDGGQDGLAAVAHEEKTSIDDEAEGTERST